MRQRLGIAASLLRDPKLLILDEPTNGLDPAGIRDMRGLITRLAAEGMTVFLSSHLLAEVEELCTRVAIISTAGSSTRARSPISTRAPRRATGCARPTATSPGRSALADDRVRDLRVDGDEICFSADEETVVGLSRRLVGAGLGIAALVPETATLEALFFRLTEDVPTDAATAA